MAQVRTIGLDLAKNVFQVHGIDAEGKVLVRRPLRRAEVLPFFAKLSPCLVGMEACATAHHWGRELTKLGHTVKLMPPAYVKPYVKRGKTDAADAEAIAEAVAEEVKRAETEIVAWCRADAASRRLLTIPGIGPITASAIAAAVPDPILFRSGRQFAAWLGLTPRPHSSGGKERLGRISKQGDGMIRRLLVVGATAVIRVARQDNPGRAWAKPLLERKPARVVSVALANKTARIAWGVMMRGEVYRAPAV